MNQRIVAAVSVLLFAGVACLVGQDKVIEKAKVPAQVLKAFSDSYPNATVKAYKTEKEKGKIYFEIESVDGKMRRDLLYAPDGKVVEIEETVDMSQIPAAISKALKKDFPSASIIKSEKTTQGAAISYEFVLTSKKRKYEVAYSAEGKQLSKEEVKTKNEKEDNEEDDD